MHVSQGHGCVCVRAYQAHDAGTQCDKQGGQQKKKEAPHTPDPINLYLLCGAETVR